MWFESPLGDSKLLSSPTLAPRIAAPIGDSGVITLAPSLLQSHVPSITTTIRSWSADPCLRRWSTTLLPTTTTVGSEYVPSAIIVAFARISSISSICPLMKTTRMWASSRGEPPLESFSSRKISAKSFF